MTGAPLIALIDYDNARDVRQERTQADVNHNLEQIADALVRHSKSNANSDEVRLRLYGGWTDQAGRYTLQGERIMTSAENIRGMRDSVRVIPEVVTALAAISGYQLKGLYRQRREGAVQKMVDTALCCDAIYLSEYGPLAIASDDDDVMIASIAVAASAREVHLLRRRPRGTALNDDICVAVGVKIFQMY